MSGFDLRKLTRSTAPPRRATLLERVAATITSPGTKPTARQAQALDELVNRAAAREHLRGSGPHMHGPVRRDVDELIRQVRRRARRRQKRVEQRLRARGELT